MGRQVLIDTNVIIDLFYRRLPRVGGAYVAEIFIYLLSIRLSYWATF
jgi:predicted nucleic acid-binding protein